MHKSTSLSRDKRLPPHIVFFSCLLLGSMVQTAQAAAPANIYMKPISPEGMEDIEADLKAETMDQLLTRMRQSPESVEVDSGTELVAYTLPGLRSELSAAKYGELLKATTTNNNPSSSSNAVMDFCSPDTQNRGDREGGGAGGHTKASRADLPHIGRRE